MNQQLSKLILSTTHARQIISQEVIQSLWSGYGEILKIQLQGGDHESVIVKHITPPSQSNHPRGWNSDRSHQRKLKSYQVETNWYQHWSQRCNQVANQVCRVATCYASESIGNSHVLILEDLDAAGFPIRHDSLNKSDTRLGLKWLANFHATFLDESPANIPHQALWQIGSYWHLATRPDELAAMTDHALQQAAPAIDAKLSNSQFQTLIHGDAKVANFCFSPDNKHIAAVDFQYVGGGCGMKDVAYFLGSCLDEKQCEKWQEDLLDYYFSEMKQALQTQNNNIDFMALETEWRKLFPYAWADFHRFIIGWMPSHRKINGYSQDMVNQVLEQLKSH